MKRGSYLINTARGKICDQHAVADALESGHLAGYAGDVWFPQPQPKPSLAIDAKSRHDTTYIRTTLFAQARYAAGAREILECWLGNKPIREEYLIVSQGHLAGLVLILIVRVILLRELSKQ